MVLIFAWVILDHNLPTYASHSAIVHYGTIG
jgi:hypothetical protein